MDNDITRGIKIYLDTTRYAEGIQQLVSHTQKYTSELKQLQDAGLGNSIQAKKLEAQIKRNTDTETKYRAALEQQKSVLENLGSATGNQLNSLKKFLMAQEKDAVPGTVKHTATLEQLRRVNDQLAISQQRVRGETEKQTTSFLSMSKMKASIVGFFAGIGASISGAIYNFVNTTSEFVNNSISLSAAADGVKHAFEAIDRPGLLDNLRKNTKNTLSDFNLMKAAVRADFFKIPLEKLGTLLKFAQLRAQQTGQSVDYMTESIVTGLGRKSLKILDNLGLSAAEINEEVAKTGDFMTGVSNIIERELAKSTDDYTAAAMKAAQKTAALENKMEMLGTILRPIKGQYSSLMQTMKMFFADTAIWMAEHKDSIVTIISVATGWWALIKLLTAAQRAWTATVAIAKTINVAYNAVLLLQAGNAVKGAQAMRILNTMIAANGVIAKVATSITYLFAAAQALLTGNLGKASIAFKSFTSSIKINPLILFATAIVAVGAAIYALTKKINTQKAIQEDLNSVEKETKKQLAEHKSQIDLLLDAIHNENLSNADRYKAIKKLQTIIPGYNAQISNTGKITKENTAAVKDYLAQLERQIRMEALKTKLIDLYTQQFEAEDNLEKKRAKRKNEDKKSGDENPYAQTAGFGLVIADMEYSKAEDNLNSINSRIVALKKRMKENLSINDLTSTPSTPKSKKDKTDYNAIALKDLETAHENELNKIRLNGQEKQETEDDINSKILASDILYFDKRIAALEKFSETTKNKRKRAEYDNEIVNLKTKKINAEIDLEKQKVSSLEKIRQSDLDDQEKIYKSNQDILEDSLNNKKIYQDEFDVIMLALNEANTQNRLEVEKQYLNDVNALELKNGPLKAEAVSKANEYVIAAELAASKSRAAIQKQVSNLTMDFKNENGLLTLEDETKLQLKVLEDRYKARKKLAEKEGQDITDLEKAYSDARENITKDAEQKKASIREKYGMASFAEQFQMQKNALKKEKEAGLISAEDYSKAEKKIKIDNWKAQFDYYSNLFSSAITALQDAEVANMEAKYDVEIEAAQGNAEEVERLENEKAQKKLDIEKKYADVNFAVKASEIIANTSVAIMMALSQLGVWGGPIAAALMAATGAAQLAAANAERMKIKNMTLSGTSSSSSSSSKTRVVSNSSSSGYSEGGYTGDGGRYEVAGPVHRGEYVVPAPEMSNPRVIDSVRVIESIRRQRTGLNPLPGFAEGGYTGSPSPVSMNNSDYLGILQEILNAVQDPDNPRKCYVLLSDLNKATDLKTKAEKPFTRGDKK